VYIVMHAVIPVTVVLLDAFATVTVAVVVVVDVCCCWCCHNFITALFAMNNSIIIIPLKVQ